jgi:mono/diheme cytochrome c family protein
MRRFLVAISVVTLWIGILAFAVTVRASGAGAQQASGWTIPPNGAAEKSPLTVNPSVVAAGKKLFEAKCARCHGALGKGDGEDGDPDRQADMDLTVAARAARNTDGTVFYKLWNGRATPKMPAFSEQISKEQGWTIVAYVQTLRAK